MILLLTGHDHIDRRLLQSDVAGSPFIDALSAGLRSPGVIQMQGAGVASQPPSANTLDSYGGESVLIVDADVWFGSAAAERLHETFRRSAAPLRITSAAKLPGGSPGAPDVLAVFLPAKFARAALTITGGLEVPSRAAQVHLPTGGVQDVDARTISEEDPPARVTTMKDLAMCESKTLRARAFEALIAGIRIRDPERVTIRGTLHCGAGVEIDLNVIIEGEVTLGDDVKIGAHSIIIDSSIGDRTVVKPYTLIENAIIGAGTFIGPYGRLRPGTVIGDSVQIGNFVEIKNAEVGAGSRINHLAFIGDATLGRSVTIGAATITCNHNRFGVARTLIGDGAYVGSGSQLVAPISIGENATIGAGSTLTEDAPAGKLTLGRARQITVPHWKAPNPDAEKK